MPTLECLDTLPATRSPGTIVVLHCQDKVANTTKITRKMGHSFVTSVRITGARSVDTGSPSAVSLEAAKGSYSVKAAPGKARARSLRWPWRRTSEVVLRLKWCLVGPMSVLDRQQDGASIGPEAVQRGTKENVVGRVVVEDLLQRRVRAGYIK